MDKLQSSTQTFCTSWGYAKSGQLGSFKHANHTTSPVPIEIEGKVIEDVAAGENHCVFADGKSVFG